nr:endolytic transglycosylase MltG [Bacteroidales bacterium]
IYWTIDAESLFKRMKREYDAFWNKDRMAQSKAIGYSPVEVMTIASIVDEETLKAFEKPIMAGVYINRLKRGIPMQACPTLKYALNDFTIKRILYEHKEVDSPYNTYKYKGLPPGPIRVPSTRTIDAVLNYKKHNYLYFCAKEDFSGEHYFSKTLREHNAYAQRYHKALNKQRIYK